MSLYSKGGHAVNGYKAVTKGIKYAFKFNPAVRCATSLFIDPPSFGIGDIPLSTYQKLQISVDSQLNSIK